MVDDPVALEVGKVLKHDKIPVAIFFPSISSTAMLMGRRIARMEHVFEAQVQRQPDSQVDCQRS